MSIFTFNNFKLNISKEENDGDEAEEEKGGYEDDDEDDEEDEEDDDDNYSAPMFDQVTSPYIGAFRTFRVPSSNVAEP